MFPETFHLTVKISIALCSPIPTNTKSFLTWLTRGVKPCRLLEKIFPQPQVWIKICYGDEWTSSQTFNYSLCIFFRQNIFFQLVENIESYWPGCKL